MADKPCKRCGAATPTYNYERDSTFWGFVQGEKKTTGDSYIVRVLGHLYRPRSNHGAVNLVTEEKEALCTDCWGDFREFMHGRPIKEVVKNTWTK